MQHFWEKKITIIVVSHTLDFIQESCDRAIWLDQGRIRESGQTSEVVAHYLEANGLPQPDSNQLSLDLSSQPPRLNS
ncbi:hypothetical protein PN462_17810 [Spirulina sp. CS-785/01]|uniref:hypothetical protein n=1 Tax=Spirulina sp. CS-785/01 TaxID=3021716 RepID=UPI00232DE4A7|nr:hypothetical protein [Spirulina sp. CS-785/01]MDB9314975.1 hypothetical protein [Spirulina sp. CS-785/01]